MAVIGEAFLTLRPDSSKFQGEAEKQVSQSMQGVAKQAATILGGVAIAAGIRKIATAGLDEIKEAQAVSAQTTAVIKSTGGAAGVTAEHVHDLAEQLMRVSGADDELIQKGANTVLQFSNIRNEAGKGNAIFDRTVTLSTDLARAMGTDVPAAASTLGLALQDPEAGMTKLRRAHVLLSDAQKESVKHFMELGQVESAQKVILDQVEQQVGGSAEAYGKTLPGQLDIARESIKNAEGALLEGLAPALQFTAKVASVAADEINKMPTPVAAVVGAVGLTTVAVLALARPVAAVVDLYGKWRSATVEQTVATEALTVATEEQAVAEGEQAAATIASTRVQNSAAEVAGLYATRGRLASLAMDSLTVGGAELGVSMLGLTAGVTGVVAGLALIQHFGHPASVSMDELRTVTEKSRAKMADYTAALNGNEDAFKRWKADISSTPDVELGITTDEKNALIAEMARRTREAGDAAHQAAAGYSSARASVDEATGHTRDYVAALVSGTEAEADITQATLSQNAAVRAANALSGLQEAAAGGVTKQLQAQADALDRLNQQDQDRLSQTNDLASAQIAYSEAQQSTNQALQDAAKAHDDVTTATDETVVASDAAKSAIIDQGDAAVDRYNAMAGSAATAAGAAQTQRGEYENIANTLSPGSPLQVWLKSYIAQLDALNGKHVDVFFATHYSVTGSAPQGFVTGAGRAQGPGTQSATGATGLVMHVSRPTQFLAGERYKGETVYIVPDNPADRTGPGMADLRGGYDSGGASGDAGWGGNVIVYVTGAVSDPDATGRKVGQAAADVLAQRRLMTRRRVKGRR